MTGIEIVITVMILIIIAGGFTYSMIDMKRDWKLIDEGINDLRIKAAGALTPWWQKDNTWITETRTYYKTAKRRRPVIKKVTNRKNFSKARDFQRRKIQKLRFKNTTEIFSK